MQVGSEGTVSVVPRSWSSCHGILQSCRVLMLQCYVWDSRRYSCPEFPALRLSGINPSKKRLSGIIKCTDTWTQSWFSISFHSIIIIIINQHIFTVTVRKTYIYWLFYNNQHIFTLPGNHILAKWIFGLGLGLGWIKKV